MEGSGVFLPLDRTPDCLSGNVKLKSSEQGSEFFDEVATFMANVSFMRFSIFVPGDLFIRSKRC